MFRQADEDQHQLTFCTDVSDFEILVDARAGVAEERRVGREVAAVASVAVPLRYRLRHRRVASLAQDAKPGTVTSRTLHASGEDGSWDDSNRVSDSFFYKICHSRSRVHAAVAGPDDLDSLAVRARHQTRLSLAQGEVVCAA